MEREWSETNKVNRQEMAADHTSGQRERKEEEKDNG